MLLPKHPAPQLKICKQESISIGPTKPSLSVSTSPPISVSPKKPNLSITISISSIPPKPVYHPAIIRVCLSMFGKKPGDLDPDEILKFNRYKAWKLSIGEDIETDIMHNPSGGNQPCLHCGHPT